MINSGVDEVLSDFSNITADPPQKRELCENCGRPSTVCWCPFLPKTPLDVKSTVVILQHPGEEKRRLRTAPMLEAALPHDKCIILKGRRFTSERYKILERIYSSPNTIVLYPSTTAIPIESLPKVDEINEGYNIIILDGTWSQARSLFYNTHELCKIQMVQINPKKISSYVIRTQPTSECLSTVETVAITLSVLENKPYLEDLLVQPLRALCDFQLKHGAVAHQSKEFLIENGLYQKPLPRRIKQKLAKHEDFKHVLK